MILPRNLCRVISWKLLLLDPRKAVEEKVSQLIILLSVGLLEISSVGGYRQFTLHMRVVWYIKGCGCVKGSATGFRSYGELIRWVAGAERGESCSVHLPAHFSLCWLWPLPEQIQCLDLTEGDVSGGHQVE